MSTSTEKKQKKRHRGDCDVDATVKRHKTRKHEHRGEFELRAREDQESTHKLSSGTSDQPLKRDDWMSMGFASLSAAPKTKKPAKSSEVSVTSLNVC